MKERTAKLDTSTWMLMQSFRGAWQRLSVALMLVMLTMTTAWAQSTFGGGSGTISKPYLIYNTDQLDQLAADVNNGNTYENVYFKLMADLDYTNKTYTPIGGTIHDNGISVEESKFRGCFLGNNHSINNVTINSEDSRRGLFGYLGYGGSVFELTLGGNSSITSIGSTGGIAGLVGNNAIISSCQVGENVVISVHHLAAGSAFRPGGFGGIAGLSSGTIMNCVSKATINNGGIAKTENLGGIVGVLYSNGKVGMCTFLGTVDGTLHVGDVAGSSSGIITSNYYHTSVRHGGVDGSDVSGTKWMGTVTFGEHVSGSLPSATFWDDSTPYYAFGKAMLMSNMNYDVQAGYVAEILTYSANDVALVADGSDYRFTMPDEDVTLTGSATVKRNIAYSNWVTINIPKQVYSGHALTPVVTVTDNMSGTPVTLKEGTDYTVTLPDGGCTDWGNYNITITGIGTFGGQVNAKFTITLPGGGSGTETNPYLIYSTTDLDGLAAIVNDGDVMSGKHFRLMADLDYSGKTYTPIGTDDYRFQGTFDGYGHSISNVVINQPNQDYQALFALIGKDGTVMNLVLGAGSSIKGRKYVGGITGLCGGTITECTVSEGVTISGNEEVGSIAGRIVGTLSWCVNYASISGANYVGGIAGGCANSTINDNLNFGAVSGNKKGGIVGFNIINTTFSNNYYAGACTDGGVQGSDRAGAMRGWKVTADESIHIDLFPDDEGNFTGFTYDGIRYLGAGETSYIMISRGYEFSGYTPTVSAGTLTAVEGEDDMYTLTMPSTGRNVNISLAGTLTLDLLDDDSDDWYNNTRRLEYNPGFTGSVKLAGRTLHKDGKWNTLCLPFDVLLEGSPLEGATARPLTAATITGTTLNLTFGDAVSTLVAGTPYMIKWESGDDIVNPVFQGVTLDATDRSVSIGLDSPSGGSISFNGTYGVMTFDAADPSILLFGGNKLHYAVNGDNLGACRAYFLVNPVGSLTDYVMNFGNDETLTGSFVERGDANADGSISVTDIAVVVNCILQLDNNGGFSEYGADANGDGQVTVTDIGVIVDKILGSPTPTPPEGGEPQ